MKRLPQTLTAAVLTGALAFGGAAVAQAQTEENTTATTPAEEVTGEIVRHDVAADPITVDGVEYFKQEDGSWLSKPVAGDPVRLTPEQAEKFVKEQQDTSAIPAPATKMDAEGNTWYQSMKDPSVYVNDPALVNVEVTPRCVTLTQRHSRLRPRPILRSQASTRRSSHGWRCPPH